MLKILALPFKIIKWFFILLFIGFGLVLVGLLLYVTNALRNPDTLNHVAVPLANFFNSASSALGGIKWMTDWATYFNDGANIAHIAGVSNTIFATTITVVSVGGVVAIGGIVLKILNKVRKVAT